MCLPPLGIENLDPNVQLLLLEIYQRRNGYFGVGASPGGRAVYIQTLMRLGLVERSDYFESGQPRFRITVCGRRAGQYLADVGDHPLGREIIQSQYITEGCPLDRWAGSHYYEDWGED